MAKWYGGTSSRQLFGARKGGTREANESKGWWKKLFSTLVMELKKLLRNAGAGSQLSTDRINMRRLRQS
jgi:hypothetical protein